MLNRRSELRPRSRKMEALYRHRRKFVGAFLLEHPMCQRCHFEPATEVHEILTRARGGSILDPDNCAALCHTCHSFITTHPRQAEAEGLMRSQYGGAR